MEPTHIPTNEPSQKPSSEPTDFPSIEPTGSRSSETTKTETLFESTTESTGTPDRFASVGITVENWNDTSMVSMDIDRTMVNMTKAGFQFGGYRDAELSDWFVFR